MRFSLATRLALLTFAAAVLASCGGGKSSPTTNPNAPSTITVAPSTVSLTHGDVTQLSTQVLNSSSTVITSPPTITYTSGDPTSVTVTSSGLVCAGVFDANNVVCQTKDNSGKPLPDKMVNITVASGGITTTVPVYVHARVDAIVVSGPANPPVCVSQSQTEQFTAKAFSNGQDVTSLVGPFTWSSSNASVATVDQNGVMTSRQPGAATIVASVASTTGTPAVAVDCPPRSISLHLSGATTTSFSVAANTAQTLAADVVDILGQPINGATLTYSSYVPSSQSISSTAVVSTPGAGVSTLVASCTPPSCNPASGPALNLNGTGAGFAVYSNPVIGTVTGTTATTVYVTGADNPDGSANTSMIPIDISQNTAGTAITLGGSPNSMVFDRAGAKAYLGSSAGMLVFDPGTNMVTATAPGITGRVLTVSNDGTRVIVSDTTNAKVFIYNASANSSQVVDLSGITAADFDSDNSKAYLTNGSSVFEYSPSNGLSTLKFAADGVAFTPQAAVAYLGGTSLTGLAVCNDARVDTAAFAGNVLAPTPDGSHMIVAGSAGWGDLSYTVTNGNGCPPTASNTLRTGAFPAFVGTPTQIAVTSNDSYAFLTGFSGGSTASGVPFYHIADATTGAIALAGNGGPLFSGGLTQDAHSLYVGVGPNGGTGPQVHRIDLTAANGPVDANQISVSFNPRIVVVRPK